MGSGGCRYVGNTEWRVAYEHGFLLASAGADELYAIEDIPGDAATELMSLWRRPALLQELSAPAARLVPQLVNAGALLRELVPGPPKIVTLEFAGPRKSALVRALSAEAEEARGWRLVDSGDADLTLLVRTGGRLVDSSDGVGHPVPGPYLFLDVAFHHTVSFGPFVIPGETACLACLAGRIGQYWGDAVPPESPAIQRRARLVGALAALELDKIAAGDYGLVNATVAFDLRRYEVKRHALYKLPWCPVCGDRDRGEQVAVIQLPWTRAA